MSLGGCRHAALPPPVETAAPAPAPAPATGAVSVRFLVADGAQPAALQPGQRLVAPFTMTRPLPGYPPEALAAAVPPATVAVRILIDTEGRVASVADTPLAASTPGPFLPVFRAAVEAALAAWEFYPAHLDTYQERDRDGDGVIDDSVLVEYRPIEVYYDLAFEFAIVGGQGSVSVTTPQRAP